ncbi:MAG: hypothetical protein CSH37_08770 [Thalassolituus sp.]|nr:MAG: hypothetical protein CSH37_08770 [Thalassolituus sp.]
MMLDTQRGGNLTIIEVFNDKETTSIIHSGIQARVSMPGARSGVMFHSDHGSQYMSLKFRQRLWRYKTLRSMCRRGNCWDNAPMERLFRSLKTE